MRSFFILLIISLTCSSAYTQNLIVINDRAGILTPELEDQLETKLGNRGFEYTTLVDYQNRCAYYYGTLLKSGENTVIKIKNCEEEHLGQKNLGRSFLSGSNEERAILLSFAIIDIIEQPGDYIEDEKDEMDVFPENEATELPPDTGFVNEHISRYFFSPSAYNLKEGELYYNTLYFFLHDIQYGISDYFSLGMGTTLIGIPFYLTPKFSVSLGNKSTLAVGDMIILGTWGSDFFGNLLYGVYTYGTTASNISFGAGLLTTNDNDITREDNSFVLNLSGLGKFSTYVYFVSENYGFQINTTQSAWYDNYNETSMEYTYYNETFPQKQTVIYGLSGLRFVNKNNNVASWQFGLTYIINFFGDIPDEYSRSPWNTNLNESGTRFIAFPTVSYTFKFGRQY
ncbi:MAG: hypothetical protein ACOCWA_09160 [Bacteroidota bacterium]